jgi:hypothetical protein
MASLAAFMAVSLLGSFSTTLTGSFVRRTWASGMVEGEGIYLASRAQGRSRGTTEAPLSSKTCSKLFFL